MVSMLTLFALRVISLRRNDALDLWTVGETESERLSRAVAKVDLLAAHLSSG
jgi:hypothetical protein